LSLNKYPLPVTIARNWSYLFLKGNFFDRSKSYFLFDKSFYSVDNKDFLDDLRLISQINEISKENNVFFTIVLLPYEYQIRNDDRTPQELFKLLLAKNQIVYIDLYDHFADRPDFEEYYLYGDGIHFSKKGHKLIADFLLNCLKSKTSLI